MASGSRTAAWLSTLETVAVVHPAHLETADPTLATEILPAPPPLPTQGKPSAPRKDIKRPTAVSYLPASDPGSTFVSAYAQVFSEPPVAESAVTAPASDETGVARRPKRARMLVNSARGNVHRVTANAAPTSAPAPARPTVSTAIRLNSPSLPPSPVGDDDRGRSQSSPSVGAPPDLDELMLEPEPIAEAQPEPQLQPQPAGRVAPPGAPPLKDEVVLHNHDHCSSCRSSGALVYCDGCPRAFHLWCLDPPIEPDELPSKESKWLCPSCSPPAPVKKRNKLDSNPIFGPLLSSTREQIPAEFALPAEIRGFFRDVTTGPRGTYLGGGKALRLHRHGMAEEREPYKMRDKDSEPVLCFRCNKSAYSTSCESPSSAKASSSRNTLDMDQQPPAKRARLSPPDQIEDSDLRHWRSIVSCDYCDLHWHLDCLDPPLTVMPPRGHKWMCPNHVDQVLPTRRIPRHIHKVVDVAAPGIMNNGFIDVIPSEDAPFGPSVDEVFIAGTRYRVPERIVLLDFWDRCRRVLPPRPPPLSPRTARLQLDAIEALTSLSGVPRTSAALPARQPESARKGASVLSGSSVASSSSTPKRKSASTSATTADDIGLDLNGDGDSGHLSRSPGGSTLSTLTPTPPPSPQKIMLKIRIPPDFPRKQSQDLRPPSGLSGKLIVPAGPPPANPPAPATKSEPRRSQRKSAVLPGAYLDDGPDTDDAL